MATKKKPDEKWQRASESVQCKNAFPQKRVINPFTTKPSYPRK